MKAPISTALLLLLFLGPSISVFGWDNPGHMAVAGLAYDELSPQLQNRLVALLRQHPDPAPITEGFPDGLPDDRSLVMAAATWPDLIKQKPQTYQDTGYEADQPAVQSVTFDHKMHKGWHFIDIPLWVGHGPAPAKLPPAPPVNAVGVVSVLVQQLSTNEPDQARAYDLGWLLHLVGDLHQPLHAANGISETYPKGDLGGNEVILEGETNNELELHAYWDDILGKTARRDKQTHLPRLDQDVATASHIMASIRRLPLGDNPNDLDPRTWASESYKMAAQDAYNITLEKIRGDRGNQLQATLDTTYNQTATADARQRIRVAGHRLALLLSKVLQ